MKLLIRVEYSKRTIQLDVEPTVLGEEIESTINENEHIPRGHLCGLYHNGSKFARNHSLSLLNIRDGDILEYREELFRIYIETSTGDMISLEVKSSDTIEIIKRRIEEKFGIQSSSYELCRKGVYVSESNIEQNSILHMALNLDPTTKELFDVTVRTLTGDVISVDEVRDSVLGLKFSILDRRGIPIDQQRLICAGRQLEDNEKLSRYGCGNGCTIHLVVRLRGD